MRAETMPAYLYAPMLTKSITFYQP